MNSLIQKHIEIKLMCDLSSYGLNPLDWHIQFDEPLTMAEKEHMRHCIRNISILSKVDRQKVFVGSALLIKIGQLMNIKWNNLKIAF